MTKSSTVPKGSVAERWNKLMKATARQESEWQTPGFAWLTWSNDLPRAATRQGRRRPRAVLKDSKEMLDDNLRHVFVCFVALKNSNEGCHLNTKALFHDWDTCQSLDNGPDFCPNSDKCPSGKNITQRDVQRHASSKLQEGPQSPTLACCFRALLGIGFQMD
jgi:hypothetical protein